MKTLKHFLVLLTCAAVTCSPGTVQAQGGPYGFRYTGQDCCETCPDDCQAYAAARYRPSATPQLIFIGVVVGIVFAILNVNHSKGRTH